ncbi:MAG: cytochrome P460 family protein [Planctomyces sp.]
MKSSHRLRSSLTHSLMLSVGVSFALQLPAIPDHSLLNAFETLHASENEPQKKATQPSVPSPSGMKLPEYTPDGKLLRPVGYERWIVVGASIGLSYSDGQNKSSDNPGTIHNVYLQPEAFDHYVRTGQFPEQTVFVVTNNPSTPTRGKDSLNRAGFFAATPTGMEVAIRDTKRFEDGWAYFMFHDKEHDAQQKINEQSRQSEAAFPTASCYTCHAEHGAEDNVFTQFYSVLTHARSEHVAAQKK